MNNTRRKAIKKIIGELEVLSEQISELQDEEQEYMDNMPENFQTTERYDVAEAAVDALSNAQASVDEAIGSLEEIE